MSNQLPVTVSSSVVLSLETGVESSKAQMFLTLIATIFAFPCGLSSVWVALKPLYVRISISARYRDYDSCEMDRGYSLKRL